MQIRAVQVDQSCVVEDLRGRERRSAASDSADQQIPAVSESLYLLAVFACQTAASDPPEILDKMSLSVACGNG